MRMNTGGRTHPQNQFPTLTPDSSTVAAHTARATAKTRKNWTSFSPSFVRCPADLEAIDWNQRWTAGLIQIVNAVSTMPAQIADQPTFAGVSQPMTSRTATLNTSSEPNRTIHFFMSTECHRLGDPGC